MLATSIRTFGLINNRGDGDATKNEFNAAMDANLLPPRYNQEIINQLYKLVEDYDRPNQGIDLITFVFYDNSLKIFDAPNPTRRWYQNVNEFTACLGNYLFPYYAHLEFQRIAQNNLTKASYQMYQYANITEMRTEDNHFLKYMQKNEKKIQKVRGRARKYFNNFNITSWLLPDDSGFDNNKTARLIFNVLDADLDGFITFYDFGNFVQVAYLFAKFDTYNKGYLYAGDILEKFTTFSEFPTISYHMKERARRFNLLSQDMYIDLLRTLCFFKIDDIMNANVRRNDKTTLYEVELKHVFNVIDLDNVPGGYLERCLRAPDENGIPKYDWECAFIKAMSITVQVLESQVFFTTARRSNLTLTNTVFYNVDPSLLD